MDGSWFQNQHSAVKYLMRVLQKYHKRCVKINQILLTQKLTRIPRWTPWSR